MQGLIIYAEYSTFLYRIISIQVRFLKLPNQLLLLSSQFSWCVVYNHWNKRHHTIGEIMSNRWIITLLTFLAILIFTTACASSTPATTPTPTTTLGGSALVQERCTVCHPLTVVERSKRTAADWKLIVEMMVSRGAKLNSEEETTVINYLAANYGQ
jgi:uncharacterized membrane protein